MNQVRNQLFNQPRYTVWYQVMSQFGHTPDLWKITDQVETLVSNQVGDQVETKIVEQTWQKIGLQDFRAGAREFGISP